MMKTMRYLSLPGVLAVVTLIGVHLYAQEPESGPKSQPEIKWDVKKEYDEQGNIIRYDSSYSWTWKHHDLHGPAEKFPFGDMDSLFIHPPFAFGPFRDFMDSFDLNFYLDSSLFHKPFGLKHFEYFPDSLWEDSFFPDSLFPDAFLPFGDLMPFGDFPPFEDFFPSDPFPFHPGPLLGPEDFFERHNEWMEKFFDRFHFPEDTLHHFHQKWQQSPRHQKKSAKGIEI